MINFIVIYCKSVLHIIKFDIKAMKASAGDVYFKGECNYFKFCMKFI